MRKIIDACYAQAKQIIEDNKDKLITIAEALLEYETLSGEDIESLYNTGHMLEHHNGNIDDSSSNDNGTAFTEEKRPSIDEADDLLDEMK